MLAVAGTLGLLRQLAPDAFRDRVRWSDVFSDILLYRACAVEAAGPPETAAGAREGRAAREGAAH